MRHIYQMSYNEFIKEMFANGFEWTDIEYYWRNPDDYEQMLEEYKKEYESNTTVEEREYWNYINSI